jgi:hypothetical protein
MCECTGQYNDAAFSLVQLRKSLEDSFSQSGVRDGLSGADLAALQAACAACDTCLEQVGWVVNWQGLGQGVISSGTFKSVT